MIRRIFKGAFRFLAFILFLASLAGCVNTAKTETGALACRGALFSANAAPVVAESGR